MKHVFERTTYPLLELLSCPEDDTLILAEHEHILDAAFQGLSRHEEEGLLSLDELLLTQLGLALGVDGVEDDAVLSVGEGGNVDHTDHLLVHVGDVRLGVRHLNQPFLTVLSRYAEVIFECADGPHV